MERAGEDCESLADRLGVVLGESPRLKVLLAFLRVRLDGGFLKLCLRSSWRTQDVTECCCLCTLRRLRQRGVLGGEVALDFDSRAALRALFVFGASDGAFWRFASLRGIT